MRACASATAATGCLSGLRDSTTSVVLHYFRQATTKLGHVDVPAPASSVREGTAAAPRRRPRQRWTRRYTRHTISVAVSRDEQHQQQQREVIINGPLNKDRPPPSANTLIMTSRYPAAARRRP